MIYEIRSRDGFWETKDCKYLIPSKLPKLNYVSDMTWKAIALSRYVRRSV